MNFGLQWELTCAPLQSMYSLKINFTICESAMWFISQSFNFFISKTKPVPVILFSCLLVTYLIFSAHDKMGGDIFQILSNSPN